MILDDIDLSCRLALDGKAIVFNQKIVTKSRQPETLSQFLDQRLRWGRGWVQLAGKYVVGALRPCKASLAARADVVRLTLTPFAGAWLCLSFVAALGELAAGGLHRNPGWLVLGALLWPFLLVPGPYLAGVGRRRHTAADLRLLLDHGSVTGGRVRATQACALRQDLKGSVNAARNLPQRHVARRLP